MTQMTSNTSSPNHSITRPAAKRFPPRDQLPQGITIEPLKGLGTTWYERGVSYWLLRVCLTLVITAMVALLTVIVGAVIHQVGPAGSPAFIAVLTAEIVFSIATGIWQFRKSWNNPHRWTSRDKERSKSAGIWAGSLGALIRAGSVLAGVLYVILAFLSYGVILAGFVNSFAPELPLERVARRELAAELELHREDLEWRRHGAHGPGKRQHKHKH